MATLKLTGIKKQFGAMQVLHGVNLDVAEGEMIVIVGASGCGKSTLLRIVAGLEFATSGRVEIGGRDVSGLDPAERDVAMVFQNYALYPHMSVFQNMAYGLKIRRMAPSDIRKRVDTAAKLLGIETLLERRPRELSGGQRQRVAMGRAIVREPKLFLFDEPLSNLDAKLRVQMRAEIKRLQRRLGVTSLFVTHDQVEAMTLGDRLVVMHQGHAAQVATPMEIWSRPADTYVASFIGSPAMNFLAGTIENGAVRLDQGLLLPLPGAAAQAEGHKVTLGIRPEHLLPGSGGLTMQIELLEPLGSETVVHGRLPDGTIITARMPGEVKTEGALDVILPWESLHLFDGATGKRLEG
jgi:sn-glycerol 3-phosphate transport system ATP-binding protein